MSNTATRNDKHFQRPGVRELVAIVPTRPAAVDVRRTLVEAGISGGAISINARISDAVSSAQYVPTASAAAYGMSSGVFAGGIAGLVVMASIDSIIGGAIAIFILMAIGATAGAAISIGRDAASRTGSEQKRIPHSRFEVRVEPEYADKARHVIST